MGRGVADPPDSGATNVTLGLYVRDVGVDFQDRFSDLSTPKGLAEIPKKALTRQTQGSTVSRGKRGI